MVKLGSNSEVQNWLGNTLDFSKPVKSPSLILTLVWQSHCPSLCHASRDLSDQIHLAVSLLHPLYP
jgi:hypothetical protein